MSDKRVYVRVMKHDTLDQIMIGRMFPTDDVAATARELFKMMDTELMWCGGARMSLGKFFDRVCIVNANTLDVLLYVYHYGEWAECLGL